MRHHAQVSLSILTTVLLAMLIPTMAAGKAFDWDAPFRHPLYVVHVTETATMYGPQKKDIYILHSAPPNKDGVVLTADGSGGVFINKATMHSGAHKTPRAVCASTGGLPPGKCHFGFSCARITPPKAPPAVKPESSAAKAPAKEAPPIEADARPTPLGPPEMEQGPDTTPIDECDDPEGELKKLAGIKRALLRIERDRGIGQAKMSLQRIAVRKIQAQVKQFDTVIRDHEAKPRNMYANLTWVNTWNRVRAHQQKMRDRVSDIFKEQDKAIIEVMRSYENLYHDAMALMKELECDSVKQELGKLIDTLRARRDLSIVELYFACGQVDKFRDFAKLYANQPEYREQIQFMLGMSYLETQEATNALYALRDALKADPHSKLLKDTVRKLEVAFLRAIDKKAQGEAAMVRTKALHRFNQFGEDGWWGAIKTFLDMGIVESTRVTIGDFDKLETLATAQTHEAAVEHAGMLLLMRLREKGYEFSDIRGWNNTRFIGEVSKSFKLKDPLNAKAAMRMRFALTQAFRNEDVDKLLKPGRQTFAMDTGKQYYDTWQFEKTWIESAYDVIDVKNVAMFLGPSAVVPTGSKWAWMKLSSQMSAAELANAVTVKDLFWTWGPMAKLTKAFSESPRGRVCAEHLLKFHSEASLPKKIFIEALVQDRIIQAGQALGGAPGHVVAEVLTILVGVGDVDQAARVLRRSGVGPDDVGRTLATITRQLDNLSSLRVPPAHRKLLNDALDEFAKGGSISDDVRRALKQSSETLQEKLAGSVKALGGVEPGPLEGLALKEAKMVQKALEDLSTGKALTARFLNESADQLDDRIKQAREMLDERARTARSVKSKLSQTPLAHDDVTPPPAGRRSPAGIQGAAPKNALGKDAYDEARRTIDLFKDEGLSDSIDAPRQLTDILKAGDSAVAEGRLTEARKLYADAAALARTLGEEAAGEQSKRHLARALDVTLDKFDFASKAVDAQRRIVSTGPALRRPAMKTIPKAQKDAVATAVNEAMSKAQKDAMGEVATRMGTPQGSDAVETWMKNNADEYDKILNERLDRYMPRLKDSADRATFSSPRVIEVGGERFVYKPASPEISNFNDVKSEVASSNLARELNRPTPASTSISVLKGETQSQGVLMRFVEDASDLSIADPATLVALKPQIADDRAASFFLRDHDRRSANYLLSRGKEFYNADHSMGRLIESSLDYSASDDALKLELKARIKQSYATFLSHNAKARPQMELLDKFMTYKVLKPAVERIEALTPAQIDNILEGVYRRGTDQWKQGKRTLMLRQKVLGPALEEAIKEFK